MGRKSDKPYDPTAVESAIPSTSVFQTKKGLNEDVIRAMSAYKKEPAWMTDFRLESYHTFLSSPMPRFGPSLSALDFDELTYFLSSTKNTVSSWDDVPDDIKDTYEKIGVPQAERKFLSGVSAQFESEVVYEKVNEFCEKRGIVFTDMDTAVRKYPDLVKKYLGTLVPAKDNKFAALNSAVWSGGSFIYVPPGVEIDLPLQAYFRMNAKNMGQFERTLIVADEGSRVHYVEGCTAPIYSTSSLHAAVVEVFVEKGARVRYTTIQNWSTNVFNLVTKRSIVREDGIMEWVDGNLGSEVTMKYPATILEGARSRADVLSLAFARKGQTLDAGARVIHLGPDTKSRIVSKSLVRDDGINTFRSTVRMGKGATHASSYVSCDTIIMGNKAKAETIPFMDIFAPDARVEHEAKAGKIREDELFYLMSRGIGREEAEGMIVNGFIEPIVRELPLEYAVELNRLIGLSMEQSVG